ncbi:MAG: GNAT family N-acetyltransferase, partial [Candidatus Tectomicrobia bacterium]|nr:GNAT family N-acetyltransferase [Candidatus Tectomicrobia bacterium]
MKLQVAPLTEEKKALWDALCLGSPECWFLHTSHWIDYSLAYRPDLESKGLSFFVYDGKEAVAICPLILETSKLNGKTFNTFSFGGAWAPAPAITNQNLTLKNSDHVLHFIFAEIIELAAKHQVEKVSYRLNPFVLANGEKANRSNWLSNFGFIPYMLNTQVIDTDHQPEQLLRDMRKGHKSDIKRAEEEGLTCQIFYRDECSRETFNLYKALHAKAAGRTTRPESTFDLMYNWIKEGHAFLIGARKEDEFIGFSLIMVYKNAAYYGSSCNNPDYPDLPIAHVIQWNTLKWLYENGIKSYEIGWQFYDSTPFYHASEKEKNIARFKRGFGGFQLPLFIGE